MKPCRSLKCLPTSVAMLDWKHRVEQSLWWSKIITGRDRSPRAGEADAGLWPFVACCPLAAINA